MIITRLHWIMRKMDLSKTEEKSKLCNIDENSGAKTGHFSHLETTTETNFCSGPQNMFSDGGHDCAEYWVSNSEWTCGFVESIVFAAFRGAVISLEPLQLSNASLPWSPSWNWSPEEMSHLNTSASSSFDYIRSSGPKQNSRMRLLVYIRHFFICRIRKNGLIRSEIMLIWSGFLFEVFRSNMISICLLCSSKQSHWNGFTQSISLFRHCLMIKFDKHKWNITYCDLFVFRFPFLIYWSFVFYFPFSTVAYSWESIKALSLSLWAKCTLFIRGIIGIIFIIYSGI
jgi:hypothetical protein